MGLFSKDEEVSKIETTLSGKLKQLKLASGEILDEFNRTSNQLISLENKKSSLEKEVGDLTGKLSNMKVEVAKERQKEVEGLESRLSVCLKKEQDIANRSAALTDKELEVSRKKSEYDLYLSATKKKQDELDSLIAEYTKRNDKLKAVMT